MKVLVVWNSLPYTECFHLKTAIGWCLGGGDTLTRWSMSIYANSRVFRF